MKQLVCDYCQKPLDREGQFGRLMVVPPKSADEDPMVLMQTVMEGMFDICGTCVEFIKPQKAPTRETH